MLSYRTGSSSKGTAARAVGPGELLDFGHHLESRETLARPSHGLLVLASMCCGLLGEVLGVREEVPEVRRVHPEAGVRPCCCYT